MGLALLQQLEKKDDSVTDNGTEGSGESVATAIESQEEVGTDSIAPPISEGLPESEAGVLGYLYLVIDDVGNNLDYLERFLASPLPLTFAVMPQRHFTIESAERIEAAGKELIVHQPMEPFGDENPGAGAVLTDMSREEVREVLAKNLSEIPWSKGMNNHMGSKATSDTAIMNYVLEYLKEQDMFFLDSVTAETTVAESVALELGLSYVKRNAVFLDNSRVWDEMHQAVLDGAEVAAREGGAIMIGHVNNPELLDVLEKISPELEERGFSFQYLSEFESLKDTS